MRFFPAFVLGFFAVAGVATAQDMPVAVDANPALNNEVVVRPSPRPVGRPAKAQRATRHVEARTSQPRSRVTLVADREAEARSPRRILTQPGPTFIGAFF